MNLITTEEMIRYLYNEMSAEESSNFQRAIESDWSLKEAFEMLKMSKDNLDTPFMSPRKSTVNAIMQYANMSVGLAQ
jgi:hypothetical protein